MTYSQVNQVGGVALVVGGICFLIWGSAFVIPPVLVGFGIWVVHLRQSHATGGLGRIGIALVLLGLLLGAVLQSLSLIFSELITRTFPTNAFVVGFILILGMALFGIATVRAKVFPTVAGQLMAASPILILLMGEWGTRLAVVSYFLFGIFLLVGKFQSGGETACTTI